MNEPNTAPPLTPASGAPTPPPAPTSPETMPPATPAPTTSAAATTAAATPPAAPAAGTAPASNAAQPAVISSAPTPSNDATAPAVSAGGEKSQLPLLIGVFVALIVIAVAVWYFSYGRTGSGATQTPADDGQLTEFQSESDTINPLDDQGLSTQ